ncbi:tyrosine-protein phosphatase [Pseudoroseomonas globiformis]|uniref:Tyrosine-protein phosphatase n=1 Tax=Teichococcus globiformis TaxID=2307229 RepID=A0ABV7FX25_9PROT
MSEDAAAELPCRISLDGCSNLRDLGGYLAADGRRVRRGQVFRASSLAALTAADHGVLAELGLRTVVDLRGDAERERSPSCLPGPPLQVVTLPVEPTVGGSLRNLLERGDATGEDVLSLLRRAYQAYATEKLPRFRALLELIAEADRRPLLFHCTAGKDRTGFAAALLLTALGVPRDTILADYLATNRLWRRERSLPEGTPAAVAEALLSAHAPLLHGALDRALQGYRNEADFLSGAMGFGPERLRSLQDALLE